jgi:hypothetical protein
MPGTAVSEIFLKKSILLFPALIMGIVYHIPKNTVKKNTRR